MLSKDAAAPPRCRGWEPQLLYKVTTGNHCCICFSQRKWNLHQSLCLALTESRIRIQNRALHPNPKLEVVFEVHLIAEHVAFSAIHDFAVKFLHANGPFDFG